jgi:hypothetical protein
MVGTAEERVLLRYSPPEHIYPEGICPAGTRPAVFILLRVGELENPFGLSARKYVSLTQLPIHHLLFPSRSVL